MIYEQKKDYNVLFSAGNTAFGADYYEYSDGKLCDDCRGSFSHTFFS
jgi:hypothetical protein